MNRTIIVTIAWLGWVVAAPAISADFPVPAGVIPSAQSAQQILPAAASHSSSHPAVKELLTGMAERERALEAAAQLEQLDLDESAAWDRFYTLLPKSALDRSVIEQEVILRKGALPILAARQHELRIKEREAVQSLKDWADSAASAEPGDKLVIRLAALREWSEQAEQAQGDLRLRLGVLHAMSVVGAYRANVKTLPEDLVSQLERIGHRRAQIKPLFASALSEWRTARNTLQLQNYQEQLRTAQQIVEAAAMSADFAKELQQRALQGGYPASHAKLLQTLAGQVINTAETGAHWAAGRAGVIPWGSDSYLFADSAGSSDDRELLKLLEEHRGVAEQLLGSLANRLAAIDEMRKIAEAREKFFSSALAYLPLRDPAGIEALNWLRNEAANRWQRVNALRQGAGDLRDAAKTKERALAAQFLGAELESLALIEGQLVDAEFALVADPFPADNDVRLGAWSRDWRADLERIEALHAQWRIWQGTWKAHDSRDSRLFAALRNVMQRVDSLLRTRGSLLAAQANTRTEDEIGNLVVAVLSSVKQQFAREEAFRREVQKTWSQVSDDLFVQASILSASSQHWTQALAAAGVMSARERQIALMHDIAPHVDIALQARQYTLPQRLDVALRLSAAFRIPWTLHAESQQMLAITTVNGSSYVLEGLLNPSRLLLMRIPQQGAKNTLLQLAALSLDGLQFAQLRSQAQPETGVGAALRGAVSGAGEEVADNYWLYGTIVGGSTLVGAGAGGLLTMGIGAGPGALAGAKAGAVICAWCLAVDAGAGALKGTVKGATADPYTQEYWAAGVDTAKGALGLAQFGRGVVGLNAMRTTGRVALPESGGHARSIIAQARDGLADKADVVRGWYSWITGAERTGAALSRGSGVPIRDYSGIAEHVQGYGSRARVLPDILGRRAADLLNGLDDVFDFGAGPYALAQAAAGLDTRSLAAGAYSAASTTTTISPAHDGVARPAAPAPLPVKPTSSASVPSTTITTITPPPPCSGLNEERNSAGSCVCRPGTEPVGGICKPFCANNMARDSAGNCVCVSGYEAVGGACVPKCSPDQERIGSVCMARCGANEERSAQNVCVCKSGFVPTAKGCAPACGPNETRDETGTCVCNAASERVNGQCVPFCGPGETRTPDGSCVPANTCGTDSDCPAGFVCSPQKVCLDKRPSGEAAVRMLQSARELRSQPGSTTTSQSGGFGVSQMPGAPSQIPGMPGPLLGSPSFPGSPSTTTPQQPGISGAATTSTTPADIPCGPGGSCPSGYTCNTLFGVCIKQPQTTSPPTIRTCATDRDCPGAKCVNNVCTQAPPTPVAPVAPVQPVTQTPTQQSGWYLFEVVYAYTDKQLKQRCTSTNRWAMQFGTLADAQAFPRKLGDEAMKTVRSYNPDATLSSSRLVSGPTQAMPALPSSGQGGIVSVRCQ